MIKKNLESERGSTLIFVLISFIILTMLVTALISLAIVNYKAKQQDEDIKTAFYLSEAGLDEAYAVIVQEVDKAIEAGNKKVTAELPAFIQAARELEENHTDSPIIEGTLDPQGEVVQDAQELKDEVKRLFAIGFKDYMDTRNTANENKNLFDTIRNYAYSINNPNYGISEIKLVPEEAIPEFNSDDPPKLIFTLQSKFIHNKIAKTTETTFEIPVPDPTNYGGSKVIVTGDPKNVLWSKALLTDDGNVFVNGKVTVDGDIYAYGKDEGPVKGGIIVAGNDDDKIDHLTVINGNVYTNGYVHTNKDKSNINIDGNIYCNSLALDQNDCKINVGGTVNTSDDIDLNGTQDTINIAGDYYGFSEGTGKPNDSSSIVINSEDIGESGGSSITINGDTFIAGTVWIEGYSDYSCSTLLNPTYQTGESISVKGNYNAYSKQWILSDPKYMKYDIDNLGIPFLKCYVPVSGGPPPPPPLELDLVDKFKSGAKFNTGNKADYFMLFANDTGNTLNLGGGGIKLGINSDPVKNNVYSAGTYLNRGVCFPGGAVDAVRQTILFKQERFKHWINKMGEDSVSSDRVRIFDGANHRFNFSPAPDPPVTSSNEILFINDSAQSFALVGPDGSDPGADVVKTVNDDSPRYGIIITKGNVYLNGDLNYNGIIVTSGNIYITSGPKGSTINHDEASVRKIVNENPTLVNLFVPSTSTPAEATFRMLKKYGDFVTVKGWKVVNK